MKNNIAIAFFLILTNSVFAQNQSEKWLPTFQFEPKKFQEAAREYAPFTRWWLPGNDLSNEELKREVKLLADNGFGGVEIQPLTVGLNMVAPKEQKDRIYSWDTPSFYEHLAAIMEQAKISKMVVDMNGGSGWPLGGSFFDPKESMRTLGVADSVLKAGSLYNGQIPMMSSPKKGGLFGGGNEVKPEWGIVQSVIAAKVLKKEAKQTHLDPNSIINLTDKVKDNQLNWQVPSEGDWRMVVTWSIPSGEQPSLIASQGVNYVIDHLDPAIVSKTYDYLLGARTGLDKYYGNPLRAVFNDSYEFHTHRIVSPDIIGIFKKLNGYDITPYLSSVFKKGYNHPTYLGAQYAKEPSPFSFDSLNQWRLMYDYDQAVNHVFTQNFINTSNEWLKKRGMLHRTQAYGMPLDPIGSAGSADLPETEQLFADGSEGALKLQTSGAHLYNRPLISQESFVAILRAEMTTPQKIKVWADKSLACGVNHFIYHGTPYKYNPGEFPKEGWNPWSSPFLPMINFSSGINETDPFWEDIKTVNAYLTRAQYAMRAGKPQYDVLIYFPFNNFLEDQIAVNPEENMLNGYLKGVEPSLNNMTPQRKTVISEWYKNLWKTVNELESKGISWEFVNDAMLQKAKWENNLIQINGNTYQTLVLSHLPYINIQTAKHAQHLSKQGCKIWAIGNVPTQQPSYFEFEKQDALAQQLMQNIWAANSTKVITEALPTEGVVQKVRFAQKTGWSRHINRQMADGSMLKFITNQTSIWQTLSVEVDKNLPNLYWFNAEDGTAIQAKGTTISYRLAPYGSIFLYASAKPIVFTKGNPQNTEGGIEAVNLDKWAIQIGENRFENSPLFEWRTNEKTKFSSEKGIYISNFDLKTIQKGKKYYLDLGEVYYTASVKINGVLAGKRIFAPYELDITKLLKKGNNVVEINITTNRRNGFVGEAKKGNKQYMQFKNKENTIVPSGLVGPVRLQLVAQ
ncbi:MAG: hypothetical protein JNL70_15775 [Saprospiraceae bacterium]|nr:hypothetical protein [Saprospiraceae bacterium]